MASNDNATRVPSKLSECRYYEGGCKHFQLYKWLTRILIGLLILSLGFLKWETHFRTKVTVQRSQYQTESLMKDMIISIHTKRVDDLEKELSEQVRKNEKLESMMGVPENVGGFEGLLGIDNLPDGMIYKNAYVMITSFWGTREEPYGDHKGIDLKSVDNAQIVPSADGIIKTIDYSRLYGWHVIVDHLNGFETIYAHLTKKPDRIKEKDTVIKGVTVLGREGNTGWSTGPHCHYEVTYLGKPVNPLVFLNNTWEVVQGKSKQVSYMVKRDNPLGVEALSAAFINVKISNTPEEQIEHNGIDMNNIGAE